VIHYIFHEGRSSGLVTGDMNVDAFSDFISLFELRVCIGAKIFMVEEKFRRLDGGHTSCEYRLLGFTIVDLFQMLFMFILHVSKDNYICWDTIRFRDQSVLLQLLAFLS